jgi:hypothetical protein
MFKFISVNYVFLLILPFFNQAQAESLKIQNTIKRNNDSQAILRKFILQRDENGDLFAIVKVMRDKGHIEIETFVHLAAQIEKPGKGISFEANISGIDSSHYFQVLDELQMSLEGTLLCKTVGVFVSLEQEVTYKTTCD